MFRATLDGKIEWRIKFGPSTGLGPDEVTGLTVKSNTGLAIIRSDYTGRSLFQMFDFGGKMLSAVASDRFILAADATAILPLAEDRLAFVDLHYSTIKIATRREGEAVSLDVRNDWIEHSRKQSLKNEAEKPGLRSDSVAAAASDQNRVYLLLNGYPADSGLPLIVVDCATGMSRGFLIPLTTDDGKYGLPVSLAVHGDMVFLLWQNSAVSSFRLPVYLLENRSLAVAAHSKAI